MTEDEVKTRVMDTLFPGGVQKKTKRAWLDDLTCRTVNEVSDPRVLALRARWVLVSKDSWHQNAAECLDAFAARVEPATLGRARGALEVACEALRRGDGNAAAAAALDAFRAAMDLDAGGGAKRVGEDADARPAKRAAVACQMCEGAGVDALWEPCGHVYGCRQCAERWSAGAKRCPVCQQPATGVRTVFVA